MSYDDEGSRQAVDFIQKALWDAIANGASAIHFERFDSCTRVRLRLDRVLQEWVKCPEKFHGVIISTIKAMSNMDSPDGRLDFGVLKFWSPEGKEANFDVSVIPGILGEKVVLRPLKHRIVEPDMDGLGMEENQLAQFRNAIHQRRGLVLLTGPTGSGKNRTIYDALDELNNTGRSIATAEWVSRGYLPGVHHLTIDEKVGLTFAAAMRSFFRSDVDVAYVREIVDLDTAQVIMKAVLQHEMLVFSTIHTIDTASTFDRLINIGLEPWVIAESVVLAQSQRLLRKLCPRCKKETDVPPEVLIEAGFPREPAMSTTVYKPAGCPACYETGYRGSVLACETMPTRKGLDKELSSWSHEDIKKVSIERGMRTLRMTALSRMCEGLTSLDEVLLMTPPDSDIRP